MIVGTSKYCHVSLSNSGPCDLNYSLSVANQNGHVVPGERSTSRASMFKVLTMSHLSPPHLGDVMELNPEKGIIYARSTVHIKVTVRPRHSETYSSVISYALTSPSKGTVYMLHELLKSCNFGVCTCNQNVLNLTNYSSNMFSVVIFTLYS